jgi:hypothetical protein
MLGVDKKNRRGVFTGEPLLKGLQVYKNKETIQDEALTECDGFINYQGCLKKDHKLTLVADIADGISYYGGGELPICTSIDAVPPYTGGLPNEVGTSGYGGSGTPTDLPTITGSVSEYDWDAGYDWDTGTGTKTNPDDPKWTTVMQWASGQMTSMNPGETKTLSVIRYEGDTFWDIAITGNGSITHKKLSNSTCGYKASSDATGSFVVTVHDAFNHLHRTISINTGDLFGLMLLKGLSYYWMVFDSNLNFVGVYPIASYTEKTILTDTTFVTKSAVYESTSETWLEKNGSTIIGPYIYYSTLPYWGEVLYCWLGYPTTSNTGAFGVHNLFYWSYGHKTLEGSVWYYNNYLRFNDINYTIYLNAGGPVYSGGSRTENYLSVATYYKRTTNSDYAFILNIMKSDGTYKTKNLDEDFVITSSGITIDGVVYTFSYTFVELGG